jgi:hypothetical protein
MIYLPLMKSIAVGALLLAFSTVAAGQAAGPWRSLSSLDQWRTYKSDAPPTRWEIKDGVLTKQGRASDLVSKDEFGDFELELEWKIGEAGNSGIFYRGTEEYDAIYWSAPEYQLLDNIKAADNKKPSHLAGAVYDLYDVPADAVKPVGEWNQARIIAKGSHIEHWLNGRKVAEYDLGSADWNAKLAASKFPPYPNFAKAPKGHLGIQGDHPGALALRNIRIRELK